MWLLFLSFSFAISATNKFKWIPYFLLCRQRTFLLRIQAVQKLSFSVVFKITDKIEFILIKSGNSRLLSDIFVIRIRITSAIIRVFSYWHNESNIITWLISNCCLTARFTTSAFYQIGNYFSIRLDTYHLEVLSRYKVFIGITQS